MSGCGRFTQRFSAPVAARHRCCRTWKAIAAEIDVIHAGDTAFFDMRLIGELYRPTIGLIGISTPVELEWWAPGAGRLLSGEMDADEGARVAEMLGLKVAIGCRYLEPDDEAPGFLELVPLYDATGARVARAPRIRETIVVDEAGLATAEAAHVSG
jgi:L-ascorbate metabolism protein UlaG (beta-lactamase superfamily)